jgi:hypothetical protein
MEAAASKRRQRLGQAAASRRRRRLGQAEAAASKRRRLLGLAEAKKKIDSDYHVRGEELDACITQWRVQYIGGRDPL